MAAMVLEVLIMTYYHGFGIKNARSIIVQEEQQWLMTPEHFDFSIARKSFSALYG